MMGTVRKAGVVHVVHNVPDERNWGVTECGLPIGPMEKAEDEDVTCPKCKPPSSKRSEQA